MVVPDINGMWYAVVNIFAASRKAGVVWRKAEGRLLADGVPFCSEMTGNHGNARSLALEACGKGFRKFIAVGGDGTVHDVLDGIVSYVEDSKASGVKVSLSDFTLAVIPVGSGNDWIKTAGVPKNVCEAASLMMSGRTGRQDVVRVSVLDPAMPEEKVTQISYMANVGGVGLDAKVCERVNREKRQGKRGRILYVSALVYNIIHRVPSSARIFCDGVKVFDGPFLSIAFGIGKYSGGGMRQTPDALPDDGLLDMTVIPDLPISRIAKEAYRLFTGSFLSVKELCSSRGRSFTVIPYDQEMPCQTVEGMPVEVDGEVIGHSPVRLEVMDEQINIILPN